MTEFDVHVRVTTDRSTPDVAALAAELARLADLEPDVEVDEVEVMRWDDDDDGEGTLLSSSLGRTPHRVPLW